MLDDFAEFESQMETYTTDILKFYAKNDGFTNIDSIKDNLNTITSRRTFNPINITYKEMVSTGNIGLVLNRDLKNKIVRYYNSLERLTLIIQNNNTFLVDQIFNPVVLKYTLFTIDLSDERFSKTTDSIIQENKLLTLKHTSNHLLSIPENQLNLFNILGQRLQVCITNKQYYNEKKDETLELLHSIEEELNRK